MKNIMILFVIIFSWGLIAKENFQLQDSSIIIIYADIMTTAHDYDLNGFCNFKHHSRFKTYNKEIIKKFNAFVKNHKDTIEAPSFFNIRICCIFNYDSYEKKLVFEGDFEAMNIDGKYYKIDWDLFWAVFMILPEQLKNQIYFTLLVKQSLEEGK